MIEELACRCALRRRRPPGARAAVPLHHPPALQAAPGQWPGPSPGISSPLDCLCPGSALANERVQTSAAGQVVLKLETAWRDGTTHLVMSPFEIDLAHCPNCGSELKIIASILEAPVIENILTHLGLQARASPRAPARGQALQAA